MAIKEGTQAWLFHLESVHDGDYFEPGVWPELYIETAAERSDSEYDPGEGKNYVTPGEPN